MAHALASAWVYFWRAETPYLIVLTLILATLLLVLRPVDRRSVEYTLIAFVLCLAGQLFSGVLDVNGVKAGAEATFEIFQIGAGMTLIRLAGLSLFRVLLERVGLPTPRIVEDIVVILAYIAFAMVRMRLAGVDLSGIVATSAVITAVVAFSMQDTLGNILGGLALQLDSSVKLGNWVKIGEDSGRIVDIRWRYTAIETRNGETIVVPNSLLMKGKFTVIWSPEQTMQPWRRWIWFNVDYDAQPAKVIEVVEQAVRNIEIENVAQEPRPNCVLMEFGPGYARYALRYWLLDPRVDDPTDSTVRAHALAALQRAGLRIAEPGYALNMVHENEARRSELRERERARRLSALRGVEIFASFSEEELIALADRLIYAPFAPGDAITRQGMIAHWLYILVAGEAQVWHERAGERHLLATLGAGHVFGEMGMLTGEPRLATVMARTGVECYRLDKEGFEQILRSRPSIAGEMADILSERNGQLASLRDMPSAAPTPTEQQRVSLLDKMGSFFRLGEPR